MKKWSGCLLVLLLLLAGFGRNVQGAQVPLRLQIYEQDNQEVLVRLTATEPLVLNAFTVEIRYDMQTYKLHKWNDEVPNGYGYSGVFRQQYEKGGTLLASETPGTVVLSGMHSGKTAAVPAGAFAQVSLLRYEGGTGDGAISLHITALNIDGKSVSLTDDEAEVTGEEMQEKAPVLAMDKPEDIAESEEAGLDNTQAQQEDAGVVIPTPKSSDEGDAVHEDAAGVGNLAPNEGVMPIETDGAQASGDASSGNSKEHENGKKDLSADKENTSDANYGIWLSVGAAVLILALAAVVCFIRIRRKRNQSSNGQSTK